MNAANQYFLMYVYIQIFATIFAMILHNPAATDAAIHCKYMYRKGYHIIYLYKYHSSLFLWVPFFVYV